MSTDESDIHYPSNKDDHCHNTEIVPSDVEYITTIFHLVCRWKHFFQISVA